MLLLRRFLILAAILLGTLRGFPCLLQVFCASPRSGPDDEPGVSSSISRSLLPQKVAEGTFFSAFVFFLWAGGEYWGECFSDFLSSVCVLVGVVFCFVFFEEALLKRT